MEETIVDKRLFKEAQKLFGENFQLDMVIEECSELIEAVQHYRRGLATENKVIKEMADVQVMLYQLKYTLHIGDSLWERRMTEKFVRLEEIIGQANAKAQKRAKGMKPKGSLK